MQDTFIHSHTLSLLYGETFYLVPELAGEVYDRVAVVPPVAVKETAKEADRVEATVHQPAVQAETPPVQQRPGIQWRPKPTSRMMFILQQTELKDPLLTDFLKKIVEAIGIPFENAGFGIINGPVNLREFEQMPNRYGVVFDSDLWTEPNIHTTFGDNEVFFTKRLAYLQNDPDSKRQLWGYLKNLKEMLK